MSFFEDSIAPLTIGEIRLKIAGFMVAAGSQVTNWRTHGVGKQILEATISGAFAFLEFVPKIVRGFASLDTSFDPGDADPLDPSNATLPAAEGFLSTFGKGTFGTIREGSTFASGFVTFTNAGPGSRTIFPEGLIFTQTGGTPPNPPPTYTNPDDGVTYPGGSVTVLATTSIQLPVSAQVEGLIGTAPTSTLSLTTSLVGCTATNDLGPVVGNDREDADTYKNRCRQAPARLSLGGPSAAYAYLAAKNLDGTVLLNAATPPVPTGITRIQVTEDSATGIVNAYFASGSGAAIPDDVTAANNNITTQALAVPDAITYTGVSATPTTIHVVGTAKIKNRPGIAAQKVAEGMVASLIANGEKIPIGGVDQIAGAGVVYTRDLEAFARAGFAGVYDVIISTPAGLSTAIVVGHVPVLQSVAGDGLGSADWVVTIVP